MSFILTSFTRRCVFSTRNFNLTLRNFAKINASKLRVGMLIERDGQIFHVRSVRTVKPGKGGAFVQTELKGFKSSTKLNERLRTTDTVDEVSLSSPIEHQFLYSEGNTMHFMNTETFEQVRKSSHTRTLTSSFYLLIYLLPLLFLLIYLLIYLFILSLISLYFYINGRWSFPKLCLEMILCCSLKMACL